MPREGACDQQQVTPRRIRVFPKKNAAFFNCDDFIFFACESQETVSFSVTPEFGVKTTKKPAQDEVIDFSKLPVQEKKLQFNFIRRNRKLDQPNHVGWILNEHVKQENAKTRAKQISDLTYVKKCLQLHRRDIIKSRKEQMLQTLAELEERKRVADEWMPVLLFWKTIRHFYKQVNSKIYARRYWFKIMYFVCTSKANSKVRLRQLGATV